MPATAPPVSLKPETLALLKVRSQVCDICKAILGSMKMGDLLSESGGISIEAQKRHIKSELAKSAPPAIGPAASPLPSAAPAKPKIEEPKSKWPDQLSDETVDRLRKRIPKDEDSPGCFLCKWIVFALGPGNKLRDYHPHDDQKQFPVKSQKLHLALEFGETEA